MKKQLGLMAIVTVTTIAHGLFLAQGHAAQLTFHSSAPVPDADDVFNFVGASRDGLNVNDDNGLDGPLNDEFTTVALDRPRQGQIITGPNTPGIPYYMQAIWIKLAGYTQNGTAPEAGYAGTQTDLAAGGAFRLRVFNFGAGGAFDTATLFTLTGAEQNNPAPNGIVNSDNGPGTWLRFELSSHDVVVSPNVMYAFDFGSVGPENRRFEWLGTNSNPFAGGSAYNGTLPTTNVTDRTRNLLTGDRVFMVEIVATPEPNACILAFPVFLVLLHRGRGTAAVACPPSFDASGD